ncbi:DUF2716 domain-containing protein [Rhodococcoides trifolii]|nr:DUF2716 domain-containing protein [Rhodococcus trifolii]
MTTRVTHDHGTPLTAGWEVLDEMDHRRAWALFDEKFRFEPRAAKDSALSIVEPVPSLTFDFRPTPAGNESAWIARNDAVNAEALRCFVTEFADNPVFIVLDWQHQSHSFDAGSHAAAGPAAEWRKPVYPWGDYCVFARDDFSEGTFSQPWHNTLCVFGDRMVSTLGRTLSTWLPVLRTDGQC